MAPDPRTVLLVMGDHGRDIILFSRVSADQILCKYTLSAAVLSDEECDRLSKINLLHSAERGDGAEIAAGLYFAPIDEGASDKLIFHAEIFLVKAREAGRCLQQRF